MAKIVDIKQERDDVVSLVLKPGRRWKGFKAGQFVQLGIEINGSLHQRTFSISSNEQLYAEKGLVRVSIQKQKQGKVTAYIFDKLKLDNYLRISASMGVFTLENSTNNPTLFIAGGVGITPILSMLSSLSNSNQKMTLMYYAGQDKPHLFIQELIALSSKNLEIHIIDTDKEGFFSVQHLNRFCPDFIESKIYLCGPQAMDNHVRTVLDKAGIVEENIISESFTAKAYAVNEEGVQSITISLAKAYKRFKVQNNKTILELLEGQNHQPKHGCRKGMCNQCACKKKTGMVYNILTNKLSDSGEEFIRICSTIPVGDLVLDL
jgi:ferredoxin-NADP reductase